MVVGITSLHLMKIFIKFFSTHTTLLHCGACSQGGIRDKCGGRDAKPRGD